ncbi:AI-2E family transporter [archaeon]|jgi:predicted PurR-regulated permease PerM|nr:AI-2E family transporter [archaeon]MBT4373179.1 AI-2E family transporter [archaeon]MBT4531524.1 AI-2E family transporter [archaeon]MBT7001298.1 AI-2E family transporter [archaeon]MBT7282216.1 AI-2E family transporter [archaeon]
MEKQNTPKIIDAAILLALVVLSFFLLKPILLSVLLGIVLAFIFLPSYERLYKKTKSKNISALALCIFLAVLVVLPFWFLTPIFISQSVKIYLAIQQADFMTPLKSLFPKLFSSEEFSIELGAIVKDFVTRLANTTVTTFSNLILEAPKLFLQSLVVFFTFFFVLRDRDELIIYLKSLLPFSENIQQKLFKQSKEITRSVLYGQIIIGILQGLLVGVGFFLFGVSNALFMTLLAVISGVFPIIGTTIVWFPLVIYLFIKGHMLAVVGITFFGIISYLLDNWIKPILVSRRIEMHSSVVLFGMIGGLFLFGIMGFILGPLILAYLLILLEIHRNKKSQGIFFKKG